MILTNVIIISIPNTLYQFLIPCVCSIQKDISVTKNKNFLFRILPSSSIFEWLRFFELKGLWVFVWNSLKLDLEKEPPQIRMKFQGSLKTWQIWRLLVESRRQFKVQCCGKQNWYLGRFKHIETSLTIVTCL